MDFTEQSQIEPHMVLEHWYYQAKFHHLCRMLRYARVLQPQLELADLGCGLGVFLTLFEKAHLLSPKTMVGIDPAAKPDQISIGGSVPILTEWPDRSFDLILLMDVLEHIKDDRAVLNQALSKLKPGGYAFITVPAFSFLWSRHDEVLGHHRRYTHASLRKLLSAFPGLKIRKLHYFYAAIFPIAIIVRLARRSASDSASDLKPVSLILNQILRLTLFAESILAPCNRLGGLTVVALVQR